MADPSVGEQIMQALVTAMNASPQKPATTTRARADAYSEAELPAYVLYATEEAAQIQSPNILLRKRRVRLEILVAGQPPIDAAVDPLFVYAVQTIVQDEATQAFTRKISQVQMAWEIQPGAQDLGVAAVDFDVTYVTAADDPTKLITG
jgi:hypothetical protein